jgi:uncharacterized phage-like protein YoqJ
MIVAFTGHRPNKLGGYSIPNDISTHVCRVIEHTLRELRPKRIISGMALGVDQWAANIAYANGIPFVAAVPFEGQELAWPEPSQRDYRKLLEKATEVVLVSRGGYSPYKMQVRNEWMVDHCDKLIAVWDGSPGGTANCVRYAQAKNKDIIRINPNE